MVDVFIKACCFIAIIFLGFFLRKIGFFKEEDFTVLSKIVLRITSTAAIVANFSGKELEPAMLFLAVLGLGFGCLYLMLSFVLNKNGEREERAFLMLNTSGYNIGNFTLPFVQNFLGQVGVITTSLFDIGNCFICLGGAYSMASIVKDNARFSLGKILKGLASSIAFDIYIVMLILDYARISLPSPVISCAQIISNANAFMAMLMIGVGFKLSGDFRQIGKIIKILLIRYSTAAVLAFGCFFLLPFSLEVRQTLMILVFSPIASAAPAFTETMKGDVGMASAINSISIVCSIACIVGICVFTL